MKRGPGDVEPRWGSNRAVRSYLGCAVVTGTPGCVVKPRWGKTCPEKISPAGTREPGGDFHYSGEARTSGPKTPPFGNGPFEIVRNVKA